VNKLIQAIKPIRQEKGVTGLETAIILIAFVVVASVFAFTVLSTGIFSAERGKETIHAGLKGARSSLEIKGSVIANGVKDVTLSLGDTAWTGSTNVTSTVDSTDKKHGTGSADLLLDASFTTGLVAYDDLNTTVDLSSIDTIDIWIKYGTTTSSGDLELILDDSAGCASSLENIDLPQLAGGTWKLVTLTISDNSDMTAIQCVGINLVTDDGSQTINVDNIVAQGQATTILVTIANALQGEPLDIREPGDADNDGLTDSDSVHTLSIAYTDQNQAINDIYWTADLLGKDDGDTVLEAGEKAQLTITLTGLSSSYPVISDTKFELEVRPENGGTMLIQRRMPNEIDMVMNLQ
jgi:flagellin-like protein